jgi:uncharacterized phage protein gp47/JayE
MAEVDWKGLAGTLDFDEERIKLFQALKEKGSKITNLNIGGVARTVYLELPAQSLADLQDLLLAVLPQGFTKHATGGWLDLCAGEYGVARRMERHAEGVVSFMRNSMVPGNIRIPKGTIVKTPTGPDGRELRFFSTQEAVLLADTDGIEVPVEAEHPGSIYNVGEGYICELVTHVGGIALVSNAENWLAREGSDTEGDEDLRERCVLRWHELSQGSTKYAYMSWALTVKGVREAVILDQHPRGQGTVDVVLISAAGAPTESLIAEVQGFIDTKRPLCSDVLVRGPDLRPVHIEAAIYIHPEDGDAEKVKADCLAALDALFVSNPLYPKINPLTIGEDATKARITHALMGLRHVHNVEVISPAEDLQIAAEELATRAGVEVHVERLREI